MTVAGKYESVADCEPLKIKGKSAIHIARQYMGRRQNFTGQNVWARGYYVSTAGRDEEVIRQYIKKHEQIDKKINQMGIFKS